MHDPKFEQEVQRRMHDLEFVPSESVWAGIRLGIVPRRRRRAVAIFWWLFPGALLVAGGMLMYRHSASTRGVAAAVPVVETGKPDGGVGNRVAPRAAAGAATVVTSSGAGGARSGTNAARTRFVRNGTGTADGVVAEIGTVENGTHRGERERYQPGLIRGWGSRRGINAPPLEWQQVKTAVSGISRPRHPWAVGFAAGGGAASVFSGGGAALTTLSASNINASYVPPVANGSQAQSFGINASAGGVKQNRTVVQAGYSYWAGIYSEKQLNSRWSVDIGLNLHYYSVRFETNGDVASYPPSSASLFAPTTYTFAASPGNATAVGGVQTYYNNYYFLEVPATVQWRLNHSRSFPLFWRGGAVFSYLMSSNGLYYNNSTGNDEKDNGVVRRLQGSVQSGLMVGLPVRGIQIQAGPEVQYALTSMLTVGSGGGHMVYGGMRVAVMR